MSRKLRGRNANGKPALYQGEEITRAQARELVSAGQAVILHASPFSVPWRLGGGAGPWLEYETRGNGARHEVEPAEAGHRR